MTRNVLHGVLKTKHNEHSDAAHARYGNAHISYDIRLERKKKKKKKKKKKSSLNFYCGERKSYLQDANINFIIFMFNRP